MQFYRQLRFHPFTRLLIPLISGIVPGFYHHLNPWLTGSIILGLSVIAFLVHEFSKSYRSRWLFGFVVSLFLFFAGLLITNLHYAEDEKAKQLSDRKVDYEAIVSGEM